MTSTGSHPAGAQAGHPPALAAADDDARSFPPAYGPEAISTHFGMVGLLQEKGMVVALDDGPRDGARIAYYRRLSGAVLPVELPPATTIELGDFLLVRSLTLPDGAVRPVAIRPPFSLEWVKIADPEAIVRGYAAGASRFVRLSAGVGSACGVAALCGLAPPMAAVAGVLALTTALGLHRRDRRDRRKITHMLR